MQFSRLPLLGQSLTTAYHPGLASPEPGRALQVNEAGSMISLIGIIHDIVESRANLMGKSLVRKSLVGKSLVSSRILLLTGRFVLRLMWGGAGPGEQPYLPRPSCGLWTSTVTGSLGVRG